MSEAFEFDWDVGNSVKCIKHGVTIAEIEEVFRSDPQIVPDIQHSIDEERLVAIGRARNYRAVFVVFTIRLLGQTQMIRPVSARFMHQKELQRYAKISP